MKRGIKEIKLPLTLFCGEQVKVLDTDNQPRTCNIVYDLGGSVTLGNMHCLAYDRSGGQCFTEELQLKTANNSTLERFQVAEMRVCMDNKPSGRTQQFLTVSACIKDFPTCASDRIIDTRTLSIRGERLAVVPGTDQGVSIPAILLGLEYCKHFPVLQPSNTVPRSIRKNHPNITAWRSQISGKIILAGEISSNSSHSRTCMQTQFIPHTSLTSACFPNSGVVKLSDVEPEWDHHPWAENMPLLQQDDIDDTFQNVSWSEMVEEEWSDREGWSDIGSIPEDDGTYEDEEVLANRTG